MKSILLLLLLAYSASAQAQSSTAGSIIVNACSDAGATDSYACNLPIAPTGYVDGQVFWFKANTSNTGAATVNLNSLGAKTIVKVTAGVSTTLSDNDIRSGQWINVMYDGTNMQMLSVLGNTLTGNQTVTLSGDVTGSGATAITTAIKSSVSLTTPVIGAATGTSLAVTGAVTSSGGGVGYATGAGGTVTQSTSKSTGVTLNKLTGTITMNAAALLNATTVSFTLTDSFIAATDFVNVQHASAGTLGAYNFAVAPASGSVVISVRNVHTASLSEAIVLKFIVLKAVTN